MKYSLRSLMTFSIRDLLWLMVVAAILTAWWLDHKSARDAHEREWKQLNFELEKLSRDALKAVNELLPNSSAPVPNPPKP